MKPNPVADLTAQAVKLLSLREHSQQELRHKLQRRGYEKDDIDVVLQKLAEQNLQSDSRFVEMYVVARAQRGYGPVRIRLELQERGLHEAQIAEGLSQTEIDWQEQVQKTYRKKFKGCHPQDNLTRMRQMRFLQYRGYTMDNIETVFANL